MIVELLFLLGAMALVLANGLFVAAEFSLVTVERGEVRRLAGAGDRGAQGVQAAIRRLSFQLSGAQLGITITSLLLGVTAEPAIAGLLRPALGAVPGLRGPAAGTVAALLGLLIATVGQMVLGELVPKNAALSRPMMVARLATPPQRAFSAVFAPLIKACNATADAIVRAFGAEPQDELASARSPDELSLLMSLSAQAGALPGGTAAMLRRALRFGDRTAAEAMTPRTDCVTVAGGAAVAEFLTIARRERHLRLPVSGGDLDDIVGVASVAGAFAVPADRRASTPVAAIGHPPVLVPGSLDLATVLERLFAAGQEMAVVVDEYGGFAGIVTVEDLAEELIGDIADEYDLPEEGSAEPASALLAPGASVAVPAGLRAHEVEERTGFQMPEGPYETLAGLLISRLGRLPETGDGVSVHGWGLRADVVRRRRIERITLTAPGEES
ncbi:membrane protein [Sphaerisporangium krabiense]|uniref:CBS domain containing-hemolysin-like protein n=1 Tax=Sphaerisporangium krabiense TaxID=763782 RepID=A0A7W9DPE8_9ACTN|nr:hemolysin family protein [Sphaerisporangium krabiense]MBB5626303.1 CBS domain containing-hemolysin-like protein [Sphaerisporangium krabiense]GII66032.1 membrane protein [Sphaerisporangium krabiense]